MILKASFYLANTTSSYHLGSSNTTLEVFKIFIPLNITTKSDSPTPCLYCCSRERNRMLYKSVSRHFVTCEQKK